MRDFLRALLDAPEFDPLPNHYRLAMAQATDVYHRACLEGRGQSFLYLLHRVRQMPRMDDLIVGLRWAQARWN
jgi:hypothetical protein